MIRKMSWEDFRETGLFWWINSILHTFGWALVANMSENGEITEVYPARVKFRGFGTKSTEDGFKKVSAYMKDNSNELYEESIG